MEGFIIISLIIIGIVILGIVGTSKRKRWESEVSSELSYSNDAVDYIDELVNGYEDFINELVENWAEEKHKSVITRADIIYVLNEYYIKNKDCLPSPPSILALRETEFPPRI